jgi:hypothetical protein
LPRLAFLDLEAGLDYADRVSGGAWVKRVVSGGIALALLVAIVPKGVAQAQAPSQAQPEPPAPTRATFVSTGAEQWDVVVDGQPMCATPCSGPLYPLQFVVLRSQERRPVLLDVGRLPPGQLLVSAKPMESGMYAGGIVATTLGGMALVTGITLLSVGLAKDRSGMSTAGLITGAAGGLALPWGIYLMMSAVPGATVSGSQGASAGLATTF